MTASILPEGPLVTAAWLRENLDRVIVLDASIAREQGPDGAGRFARGETVFAQAHIPGARFADLFSGFSDPQAVFPFTVPTADQLQAAARAAGIRQNSQVVVYDQLGDAWAARVWLVLRAYGFERVRVLAGGLTQWQAAGGETASGPEPEVTRGDFAAGALKPWFVETSKVDAIAAEGKQPLISALRDALFEQGHIPGSLSLPWPDLRDATGAVDPIQVRQKLAALGVSDDSQAVLYCGGGINAAGLALAFETAGLPQPSIYDDSLNGWRNAGLPLATGPAQERAKP